MTRQSFAVQKLYNLTPGLLQLTYLADRREVSLKYSGVACSFDSNNACMGCHSISSACSNARVAASCRHPRRCSALPYTQQKLCFGLWLEVYLAMIYFFMVYPQNYFNCSTLDGCNVLKFTCQNRKLLD
jgi:hypothetical protein